MAVGRTNLRATPRGDEWKQSRPRRAPFSARSAKDSGLLETLRPDVNVVDFSRSIALQEKLPDLSKVSAWFDGYGRNKFSHVSLSVLRQGGEAGDAGTRANKLKGANPVKQMRAQRAVDADRQRIDEEAMQRSTHKDRLVLRDVTQHRVHLLFAEVPEHHRFIPRGVDPESMLPALPAPILVAPDGTSPVKSPGKRQPVIAQRGPNGMREWSLTVGNREEREELVQYLDQWVDSSSPLPSAWGCMDRATFCRFLLDSRILDLSAGGNSHLNYAHAVSLFDGFSEVQNTKRVTPGLLARIPVVTRVNVLQVMERLFDAACPWPQQPSGVDLVTLTHHRDLNSVVRRVLGALAKQIGKHRKAAKRGAEVTEPDRAPVVGFVLESELVIAHRDRHVRNMMIEPEVLHWVTAYRGLFQAFYDVYCEEPNHMPWPLFLQFASDLQLSPKVISRYHLQHHYSNNEEWIKPQRKHGGSPKPGHSDTSPRDHHAGRPRHAHTAPEASIESASPTFSDHGDHHLDPDERSSSPNPDAALEARKPALAAERGESRKTTLDGGRSDAPDLTPRSRAAGTPTRTSKPGSSRSARATVAQAAPERPRKGQGPTRVKRFGFSAFVETIVRGVFVFLTYYGNENQRSAPSEAKFIWLITFLRCSFLTMQDSRKRKIDQGVKPSTPHNRRRPLAPAGTRGELATSLPPLKPGMGEDEMFFNPPLAARLHIALRDINMEALCSKVPDLGRSLLTREPHISSDCPLLHIVERSIVQPPKNRSRANPFLPANDLPQVRMVGEPPEPPFTPPGGSARHRSQPAKPFMVTSEFERKEIHAELSGDTPRVLDSGSQFPPAP